jgi:hypothetical protein
MMLITRQAKLEHERDYFPEIIVGEQALDAMGMSSWRRDRALDKLEAAGLIKLERRRGRSPRITLVGTNQPADAGAEG